MCKKLVMFLIILVGIFSCKEVEREAERTGKDLKKVAQATGTDEVYEAATKKYDENLGPWVKSAGDTIENHETLRSLRDLGAQACEHAGEIGSGLENAAAQLMSRMPQDKHEINETINSYNDAFVDWLKENFPQLKQNKHESLKDRIRPRGKPRQRNR